MDTPEALAACIASLAAGHGPTAVDAERAQSFRYTSRGYLFQFRRAGSGTHLVDPVAFDTPEGICNLSALGDAINDDEWIIHAATQDLPCLVEAGLVPRRVFDTELTGRLLGLNRVGLGPLIEEFFGVRLLKEHSAANWSVRPIPQEWLVYAALDVELLVELRDLLLDRLKAAGKLEWALQEFEALVQGCLTPSPPRPDRWRRTSGTHAVRTSLGLAVVRELWVARDEIARREDSAPGRVLIDQAITDLATLVPRGNGAKVPARDQMRAIDGFKRRQARRWENNWVDALDRVAALPTSALPPLRLVPDGPPNPRTWEIKDPAAWARWQRARPATNELA
ncbi:MAG TPA: HRDC domain-containing protein, partial [Propionibacteriaceae bacterium]|nr:HRDC domain-containing protein [Propionibacteriaceae bacterium]